MSERSKRTLNRVIAVQMLYLSEFNQLDLLNTNIFKKTYDEVMLNIGYEDFTEKDMGFVSTIIESVFNQINEIDLIICNHLTNKKGINSVNLILKSILRCGVCELIFIKTPFKVVISEYVLISKDFLHPNEVNLTNGILDKISQSIPNLH